MSPDGSKPPPAGGGTGAVVTGRGTCADASVQPSNALGQARKRIHLEESIMHLRNACRSASKYRSTLPSDACLC